MLLNQLYKVLYAQVGIVPRVLPFSSFTGSPNIKVTESWYLGDRASAGSNNFKQQLLGGSCILQQ